MCLYLPCAAKTLYVTDKLDGSKGSLRTAIELSEHGDTIQFALEQCPCEIALTEGEIVLDHSLTIAGPGSHWLSITGSELSRVFRIGEKASVVISGVSIRNGSANNYHEASPYCTYGGGVLSYGDLTIADAVIRGNVSPNGFGGGIAALRGSLSLIRTSVVDNVAGGDTDYCAFGYEHKGGGLFAEATDVRINASEFSGNVGGAIAALYGQMRVDGSNISNNAGTGIYLDLSQGISINESSVNSNKGGGVSGYGGIEIRNSTIAGNGGTGVAGIWPRVSNSTLSGNFAGYASFCPPDYGPGHASAVDSERQPDIDSVTVTGNYYGVMGWADKMCSAVPTVTNSIVAGNVDGQDLYLGGAYSLGYNLIGNVSFFANRFTETGDIVGTAKAPKDPMLGPLGFNGGPTQTHELLEGSPAIDMGNSFKIESDQRGISRPFLTADWLWLPGNGSDIGAFEVYTK